MNDPIGRLKMTDHGTRLEHLMDLQDLWGRGLAICTQGMYQTEPEKERAKELKIALKLLVAHMQKDFPDVDYAREINALPKNAEDIKDDPPRDITTHRDTV